MGPPKVKDEDKLAAVAQIMHRQGAKWASWRFDGDKRIFCLDSLPPINAVARTEGGAALRVAIRCVAEVNLTDVISNMYSALTARQLPGVTPQEMETLTVSLDVAIKHAVLLNPGMAVFGPSAFPKAAMARKVPADSIGDGRHLCLGANATAKVLQDGVTMNVELAAIAVIPRQSLLQLVADILSERGAPFQLTSNTRLQAFQERKLRTCLKKVRVETNHMPQRVGRHDISDFSRLTAETCRFDQKDRKGNMVARQVSVATYFQNEHGIKLRFPNLPLVEAGKRDRLLPMELLDVPGGQRIKLTDFQTGNMIRKLAIHPATRLSMVQTHMEGFALGADPVMRDMWMTHGMEPLQCQGRVLPHPVLQYTPAAPEGTLYAGGRGDWGSVADKLPLKAAASINSWVVMSLCEVATKQATDRAAANLAKHMQQMGLKLPRGAPPVVFIGPPPAVWTAGEMQARYNAAIKAAKDTFRAEPQLFLCVLPGKLACEVKAMVSAYALYQLGVPCQCLLAGKAGIENDARGQDAYMRNLALKINVKASGTNWTLLPPSPTVPLASLPIPPLIQGGRPPRVMVIGADVNHPSPALKPGEPEYVSFGALVASVDDHLAQYASRVIKQEGRVEPIAAGLDSMTAEMLLLYHRNTGALPDVVLYVRDGVGAGMFDFLCMTELPQIRTAFQMVKDRLSAAGPSELAAAWQPRLTLMVAMKRHKTRFHMPPPALAEAAAAQPGVPLMQATPEIPRNKNVVPGTVVDTNVCHPWEFDFYLTSHASMLGTAKPVHYHVLWDEVGFDANSLQTCMHWLCFSYARCHKSVSLPAPAYYAHLAAKNGRDNFWASHKLRLPRPGQRRVQSAAGTADVLDLHPRINNSMWYA